MNSKKLMKRIVAAMMALVCALSAVVSASAANLSSLAGDMFNSAISKGADVVNAKPATGYWSKNLSRNGQTAYNKILDAVQKYQSSVKLSDNLTSEELKEIPQIIINEHPELFYYDVKKSGAEKSYNENGFVDSYIYHPSYMDNYKQKISEVENAANQILAKAPRNGSDYDKELFVHDQLRDLVTYKLGANNIYNSLVQHQGSCMGYSFAMQYLLNKLGVSCRVQTGRATSPKKKTPEDYMWNIVTLDGKEYLVDVTWDDIITSGKNYTPYRYFNVTKDMMKETHNPKNTSEWNNCTNTDQDWYRKNGYYFTSWADAEKAIPSMIQKQGGDKGKVVTFRMASTNMAKDIGNHMNTNVLGKYMDGKTVLSNHEGSLGATGFVIVG